MAIDPGDIRLEEGDSKGRYVYRVGDDAAEMTFSKAGASLVIIDHSGCRRNCEAANGQSGSTFLPAARKSSTARATSACPTPWPRNVSGTSVWSMMTRDAPAFEKVISAASSPTR